MGAIAQDFIAQFHNLPGETIKDKHQNSFQLLNRYRSLAPEELESIAKNLQSTNHLEKILRTDFLIYFRRFDELYEDFKTGDDITMRKLSKQGWFFQKAFNEVSCEEFADTILPAASYSLKCNILKKLPVDGERMDEIFDAVCKRYGIFLATILVPKCTAQKIHKIFTIYPVKLTVAQLKVVYHKDPNLICVYLDERKKLDNKSDLKKLDSLFKYIAQKSPKLFSSLFEKYEFDVRLGRRTTKRFIDCQRNSVAENTEDYLRVLNKNVAVRKMGTEIKSVLFKHCPEEHDTYWKSIIKFYPKNQQFTIFQSTYNSVHHYKFGENIDAVSQDMLKLIPDKDERDALAKKKVDTDVSYLSYLIYVTPENCLKYVMEKINHSKSVDRATCIESATECCILNKDVASLLKISELVNGRLKNDDRAVRYSFLSTLTSHKDIFDIFDENNWKVLTEILAIAQAKNEWIPDSSSIKSKYLRYLVKNKKCIKNVVQKYNDWLDVARYTDINKYPETHKLLLIELLETGFTDEKLEELDAAKYDCILLSCCKTYNEENPTDVIDVFDNPRIIKSVRHALEAVNTHYYFERDCLYGIKYFICRSDEKLQELKTLYFKNLKHFGSSSILMWFLRHDPKTLQDNFDAFLETIVEVRGLNAIKLWKCIKKYTHLGLDKRTIEFCKQKLGEEGYKDKEKLVKALTILNSAPSHIKFIKAYIPVSEKVDLTDEEVKDLYNLQGNIVRFLRYLKPPTDVLNATFDFCKGDYLSFALTPLYSCLYKLPEAETKPFIKKLGEIKALSVKKHSMHLSCVMHDTKTVYDCLKTATVPSLMATLKYFVKNPSEDLWKILESKINALEDNEIEMLKWALVIKVPLEYRHKYVEAVWGIIDKYDNKDLKKILVNTIDEKTIQNLNPDFAFEVVKRCIFKFEDANSLVAKILIYLKTDEKFALISDILSKFKKNCYNQPLTRKSAQQKLDTFILEVFTTYMNAEDVDHEFVSKLSKLFGSIFSLSEAFQGSIAIKCMTLKEGKYRKKGVVVDDETVKRCSKVLVALNNDICKDYGSIAVPCLTSALNISIFGHMFTTDDEKVRLCHSMLKYKKSVTDYLLILDLLPSDKPEGECFVRYEEICTELSQVSDNAVQLQFSLFLGSGSTENSALNWDQP